MTKRGLRVMILLLLSCGCMPAQCVPGGMAVIVNKANPVESLSTGQLRTLILGDLRTWQNHKDVALISRAPSTQVYQCVLSSVVRLSAGDYQRYIINAEFRGDEPMAIQTVDSDLTAARYVSGNPGGMAVVEANSVSAMGGAVKVLRIDGKTLGQPGYPL